MGDGELTAEKGRALEPASVPASGGEARWWGEGLALIKATGADTGGQMAIIEVTEPPGAEAPMHVHHREDEAFWVLEGEVTFDVGGDLTITATKGDYAFGPRDIQHGYRVGPAGCRMLFIVTPAGFEDLVRLSRRGPNSAARSPGTARSRGSRRSDRRLRMRDRRCLNARGPRPAPQPSNPLSGGSGPMIGQR